MIGRADVGLSDLIRVVAALAPDDVAQARKLARILSIIDEGEDTMHEPAEVRPTAIALIDVVGSGTVVHFVGHGTPPAPAAAIGTASGVNVLTPRPRRTDAMPAYEAAGTLEPPVLAPPRGPLPSRLSLFEPRWTRNLLAAVIATDSDDGDIDLERLVDALARYAPLRELPRRAARTLRRGVDVLVDRGDGMLPFRRDVAQLVDRLDRVAGELTVRSFRGNPTYAPRGRTPVVAIGDVAAGGWLRWAQRLRHRGCPVAIITPVDRAEWPAALARTATIVAWDRTSTASAVHRARVRRRHA